MIKFETSGMTSASFSIGNAPNRPFGMPRIVKVQNPKKKKFKAYFPELEVKVEDIDTAPHQFEFFVRAREVYILHETNGGKKIYALEAFSEAKFPISSENVLSRGVARADRIVKEVSGSYFLKLFLEKVEQHPQTKYAYQVISEYTDNEIKKCKGLVAIFFDKTRTPFDFTIGSTLSRKSIRIDTSEKDSGKEVTAGNYTPAEIFEMIRTKIEWTR